MRDGEAYRSPRFSVAEVSALPPLARTKVKTSPGAGLDTGFGSAVR